jgi:hypothetical protein
VKLGQERRSHAVTLEDRGIGNADQRATPDDHRKVTSGIGRVEQHRASPSTSNVTGGGANASGQRHPCFAITMPPTVDLPERSL